MTLRARMFPRLLIPCAIFFAANLATPETTTAQAVPYAREYPKPPDEIDKALKDLQAYVGQKLPIVDGFVAAGDQRLDRYERAFYQFAIDVVPDAPTGTIVRVTAKITAWYADRDPAKSGYQVLPSNGRLELDLLDRLTEKFGGKPSSASPHGIQAPKPKLDLSRGLPGVPVSSVGSALPSSSAATSSAASSSDSEMSALRTKREAEEKHMQELHAELESLQDIQRHQAHPLNLVAVKKSATPVLAHPSDGAKLLFSASAGDEFEFLDAQGEWIHVQISGASRGYIRRSSLELPESIAARLKTSDAGAAPEAHEPFRVASEITNTFPGDWAPLRGKSVRIYTVQPVSDDSKETGAKARLEFATGLFEKFSSSPVSSSPAVDGVVIIFDSSDGGIVGATISDVSQLAKGTLTRDAFWKLCYLDPPDAFQPPVKH